MKNHQNSLRYRKASCVCCSFPICHCLKHGVTGILWHGKGTKISFKQKETSLTGILCLKKNGVTETQKGSHLLLAYSKYT